MSPRVQDPVARALEEAPYDDEPLTAEDLADLDAAERDRQESRVVSHDEARRQVFRALATATAADSKPQPPHDEEVIAKVALKRRPT